jgi:hypothetical protein
MIVTVQETIEHSADITAEMVRAHLLKRGYVILGGRKGEWTTYGYGTAGKYVIVDDGEFISRHAATAVVDRIGALEGRAPHLVIADIAEVR